MDAATYAAALCATFLIGAVALGALLVCLLDRATTTRRDRPAQRPRDPYAEAQALAARRRAEGGDIGRARVPVTLCGQPGRR